MDDVREPDEQETKAPDGTEEAAADSPEVEVLEAEEPAEADTEAQRLQAEAEEWKDRYLRLQADFDNFKRRTQRDAASQRLRATEALVKDMLPVLDNLQRALASVDDEAAESGLAQGVRMVLGQMIEALEKQGLRPIESVGTQFDPTMHEAVMKVDSEEHETGEVVEEFQKGYYLGDRVLRASIVKVAE